MCQFGDTDNVERPGERPRFKNCNLFKRSYTNKGIGFTFNNNKEDRLINKEYRSEIFFHNVNRDPSFMTSANSEHSLHVVIENNAEEVERYLSDTKDVKKEPIEVSVSLHDPKEPADLRTSSLRIPLGHFTTVYVTPRARHIDESGKKLTEQQRNCRLEEETEKLNIFNTYTRAACLLECKLQYSLGKCGCLPWDYPYPYSTNDVCMFPKCLNNNQY